MWIRAQGGILVNADKLEVIVDDKHTIRVDGNIKTEWRIRGISEDNTNYLWQCETEQEAKQKMEKINSALRWSARYVDLENGSIFGMEV